MPKANKLKKLGITVIDGLFFLGGKVTDPADNWKFRRRLIYGAYRLAVAMIVFGAITFFFDTGVSNQLVIGGVAILTIIATAYTASATYEDVKKRQETNEDSEH